MKKNWFVILLFIPILLIASQSELSLKISKLQHVKKSERYKLMNEIKRELAHLNTHQRTQALRKLHATMHKKDHTKTHFQKTKQMLHQHLIHHKNHTFKQEMQKNHQHQQPKKNIPHNTMSHMTK